MKLIDQFKAFALRGSVIDLAVGVVIGAAFGKVVSSLVADIIMPPLGWLIGGVDFTRLTLKLPETILSQEPVAIKYGYFIQSIFDFMIIALAVFFAVKFMIRMHVKQEKTAAAPAPAKASNEELLLTEIRDLLKEKQN